MLSFSEAWKRGYMPVLYSRWIWSLHKLFILEKIFDCMALAWKTKSKSKCPLLQSFHFNRRSVWDLFQVERISLPEWCSLQVDVPAQMHKIYWSNCSCQADHSFSPTLRMQEFREMVSKCNNRWHIHRIAHQRNGEIVFHKQKQTSSAYTYGVVFTTYQTCVPGSLNRLQILSYNLSN